MSLFVDTSALLALLDSREPWHDAVAEAWNRALENDIQLATSNYVVVECFALVQRRKGLAALVAVADTLLPLIEVIFVDAEVHGAARLALVTSGRRRVSFVDCTSFELMRRRGIREVLTLDSDFVRQGFQVLPG